MEDLADILAGGITYPRVFADHADSSLTCATCGTFPEMWPADDWKCRRRGQIVGRETRACELWREKIPAPEIDEEAFRAGMLRYQNSLRDLFKHAAEPTPQKPNRPVPEGLRGSNEGVVYFVDCGVLTKIGVSHSRVGTRLQGMETDNPFPKKLWALIPGYTKEERKLHELCAACRYKGEWFRLTPEYRAELRSIILEVGGEVYE